MARLDPPRGVRPGGRAPRAGSLVGRRPSRAVAPVDRCWRGVRRLDRHHRRRRLHQVRRRGRGALRAAARAQRVRGADAGGVRLPGHRPLPRPPVPDRRRTCDRPVPGAPPPNAFWAYWHAPRGGGSTYSTSGGGSRVPRRGPSRAGRSATRSNRGVVPPAPPATPAPRPPVTGPRAPRGPVRRRLDGRHRAPASAGATGSHHHDGEPSRRRPDHPRAPWSPSDGRPRPRCPTAMPSETATPEARRRRRAVVGEDPPAGGGSPMGG